YVQQSSRFFVKEGVGCSVTVDISWFSLIAVQSWPVVLPSVSVFFYCPKVIYVFYHHSRATNEFFRNNTSVARLGYFRLLALASVDIVLTLPYGVISTVQNLIENTSAGASIPFFREWKITHSNWAPVTRSYAEIRAEGSWALSDYYLSSWTSVALSLVIFALFGMTPDARATYRRGFYAICKPFGLKP
ncbi:GPCR fungal pheromone mating factor, partial [Vararia minispora EC-137]